MNNTLDEYEVRNFFDRLMTTLVSHSEQAQHLANLREELSVLVRRVDGLEDNRSELAEEVKTLNGKLDIVVRERDDARFEVDNLEWRKGELEAEVTSLRAVNAELSRDNAGLVRSMSEARDQIAVLTTEKNDAWSMIHVQAQHITAIESAHAASERETARLAEELGLAKNSIEFLENTGKSLADALVEKQAVIDEISAAHEDTAAKFNAAIAFSAEQGQTIEAHVETIFRLEDKIVELTTDCERLGRELRNALDDANYRRDELRETLSRLHAAEAIFSNLSNALFNRPLTLEAPKPTPVPETIEVLPIPGSIEADITVQPEAAE